MSKPQPSSSGTESTDNRYFCPSISLIGGFVLSLIGSLLVLSGSLALFAILYSIGVVVSFIGTGFLIGFIKQLKQMFNRVRLVATIVMIVAFVMVWVSAFAINSAVSTIDLAKSVPTFSLFSSLLSLYHRSLPSSLLWSSTSPTSGIPSPTSHTQETLSRAWSPKSSELVFDDHRRPARSPMGSLASDGHPFPHHDVLLISSNDECNALLNDHSTHVASIDFNLSSHSLYSRDASKQQHICIAAGVAEGASITGARAIVIHLLPPMQLRTFLYSHS